MLDAVVASGVEEGASLVVVVLDGAAEVASADDVRAAVCQNLTWGTNTASAATASAQAPARRAITSRGER